LFGEPATGMQSAVGAILPAILAGVMKQGSTADGAAGLMKLLSGPTVDAGLSSNIGSALGGGATTNGLMTAGGNMLKGLFGDNASNLASTVSSMAGIKSSSAINLLSLAVPMVLSFLKNHVMQNGLNAGGLMSLLSGQSSFLQGKLDNRVAQAAGFGDASGFLSSLSGMASKATGAAAAAGASAAAAAGSVASRAGSMASDAAHVASGAAKTVGRAAGDVAAQAADSARDVGTGMGKMLPWIIGLIVLAVLFFMFRSCGQQVEQKAGEATKAVSSAVKSLSLPGGVALNVPAGGFIDNIYVFLSNKDGGVGTGYALDAVTFETGSATLTAASNQQLDDLAAVLKTFPTATVSVNGYTDNTGDAAANTTLSTQRAEAVKSALVSKGIATERVAAAGYGPDKPIASNDTEAGKAKNRRVEIVVTKR
jgi:outer membrane protein OmpA-like peptidoglycan-associated protein